MRSVVLLLAGLTLATAGCGTEIGPAGGSTDVLRDRTFLSTTVSEGGKDKVLAPSTRVRLQFTGDERLLADAGCNSMQAQVSTADGKITVDGLGGTEMGCDRARHAQDEWLAKLLEAKPTWQLAGQELTIASGGTTLVLQDRKVLEPDLPLEGTRWTLESLVQGDAASHSVGMEKAYLEFAGGKVTGSTGCNTLTGPAKVVGATIEVGPVGVTRRGCAGAAATIETAVLDVLAKGPVTFAINSSRLTLRSSGQYGMDLTGK